MGGVALTFARPELLALAPLAVLLVALCVTAQWRRGLRLADAYGGDAAGSRLAARDLARFPMRRLGALIVAAVALPAAAAGPAFTEGSATAPDRLVDVVVAVDLSRSMSVEDVGGSRALRAHAVVERLVEALGAERVGLAVFADWPYTLVPLTDDPGVLRFFAASLSPELVVERDQGSDLGAVVTHARRTLDARRRESAQGVIVLVSDGEVHDDEARVVDSVGVAVAGGVRLWTAGVGTEPGGPLPAAGEDGPAPVDERGGPVIARANPTLLRTIAAAGGGAYHDVSDDRGLRALVDDLTGVVGSSASTSDPPDPAWWLALAGLLALLVESVADAGRRPWRRARGSLRP